MKIPSHGAGAHQLSLSVVPSLEYISSELNHTKEMRMDAGAEISKTIPKKCIIMIRLSCWVQVFSS